ncbi:50S ribosomal protein L7/L12 [Micromonospora sp. NBS 11-29]|uniref:50S ribosomal protein L7/L12 n=1 Tax=Micromonospora sp. NBS 11-29 TaxID=1960879 RepID=UPI000B774865|nr:50S ribosomal protein L7/L12 [Micromonospora sp. NBS 11-29]
MPEAVPFALLAVLVVLLVVLASRRGRPRDLVAPDPATGGGQAEVLRLARAGRTVEAVRLLRRQTGLSLLAAKQTVDLLVAGGTPPAGGLTGAGGLSKTGGLSGAGVEAGVRAEVARLAHGGRKIQAIKLLREHTGWSLVEAKRYVERL